MPVELNNPRALPTKATNPETIAFNERLNKWSTFYSFYPEMYATTSLGLLAWNDGKLHKMFKSTTNHNVFFGVESYSEMDFVSNQAPLQTKVYKSISIDGNEPWEVVSVQNERNQDTDVKLSDYKEKEGVHYAPIMKDKNSRGGQFNGDDIRSQTLIVKLRNKVRSAVTMVATGLGFSPSSRHMR